MEIAHSPLPMVLDTALLAAEAARRKNTPALYRERIIPLQIGLRRHSFASL
jgi:hypothetical protein